MGGVREQELSSMPLSVTSSTVASFKMFENNHGNCLPAASSAAPCPITLSRASASARDAECRFGRRSVGGEITMIERSRRITDAFVTDLDSGNPVLRVLLCCGPEPGTPGPSTTITKVSYIRFHLGNLTMVRKLEVTCSKYENFCG